MGTSPPKILTMRPLTETETQTLFAKRANHTGSSLKNLIAPLDNGPNADRFVFRLHQSRCYYVRLSLQSCSLSSPRKAPVTGNLSREVHQDRKVQTAHHGASYPRRTRTI